MNDFKQNLHGPPLIMMSNVLLIICHNNLNLHQICKTKSVDNSIRTTENPTRYIVRNKDEIPINNEMLNYIW